MSGRPVANPRLVSSLRWRLSTAITSLILLSTIACVASTVIFLQQQLKDNAESDLQHSLTSVSSYMRDQRGELLGIARLVAADPLVEQAVQRGDHQGLVLHLVPDYADLNVDVIDVIDARGRTVACMEATSVSGGAVGLRPDVRAALQGRVTAALETDLPQCQLSAGYALRATVPIRRGSRIVGAMAVGRQLDALYAGRIGRAVDADINLIVGKQRTGTTLTDSHGLPIMGLSEPPAVLARIARQDEKIVEVSEDGQTVLSGLVPLLGPNGRPAGAVEVVSRLDPITELTTKLSVLLIAIGAVVVLLGTILALGLARRLTRRLQLLEATASHVAEAASAGAPLDELHPTVPISGQDEVASLARSVSAMMGALDQRMAMNARLYEAAQARVRELTGLAEIARLLTAVPSMRETLDVIGECVSRLVGCSAVAIWVPGDQSMPALSGGHGLPEHYEELSRAVMAQADPAGESLSMLDAMRNGRPLWRRFDQGFSRLSPAHARLRKAAQSRNWGMATALPLMVQGHPVGAITCYSVGTEPMSDSDLSLLTTIADQVAVAVENMRLYAESRALAALEERARLARELHDSVTQALFSMTLHARAAEMSLSQQKGIDPNATLVRSIAQLHELTRGALAEMRALIFELRPGALQEEGLVEAVRKHTAAVSAREGLAIELDAPEDRVRLDGAAEEHLYRVVQEAVHNVVKHAGATHVSIHLDDHADGLLVVEVTDDGAGFDPGTVTAGHMGLTTMADRTHQIGGSLQVISAPGEGTTVRAVIPLSGVIRPASGTGAAAERRAS